MTITVLGAGVAGLCTATALDDAGLDVRVQDRAAGSGGASWLAGGMLAPWCECETAPVEVLQLGRGAVDWWAAHVPGVARNGTLVVAPARDGSELAKFSSRTDGHERINAERIAALEPDLAGRFSQALFFAEEGHLDPRKALSALCGALEQKGIEVAFATEAEPEGRVVDCRGLAARDALPNLRAVRGEMLLLRCPEFALSRPVRLLHPRFPLYIVPRGEGLFMVGATMVESDRDGPITARAMMELLSAAYALHPALADAEIVETGVGLRPAYPDNLPAVREAGGRLYLNGMYRHGFLLAPAMAARVAAQMKENTLVSAN